MLAWASADELLAHHLELGSEAKAFWKDGFLLYALWAMGDFCVMIPPGRRSSLYPYTRTGFYQFLRDHGSQIIPGGGQPPHQGIQGIQPVRGDDHPYGRTSGAFIRRLRLSRTSKTTRSGTCWSCALRRPITDYGRHCRKRIRNLMAVAGAAVGLRQSYVGPLSAAQCS